MFRAFRALSEAERSLLLEAQRLLESWSEEARRAALAETVRVTNEEEAVGVVPEYGKVVRARRAATLIEEALNDDRAAR